MIGPNASLSVRGAWLFMGLISFGTLAVATWCTAHGFWPVLPFAGLELAAVGWALSVSMRRSRYREVISFDDERVSIEFGLAGQGVSARIDLPRAWTRVWLEKDGSRRNAPTRLLFGSSAQRVVVAGCLTDEEREVLLVRFKDLLQPARRMMDVAVPAGLTLGEG